METMPVSGGGFGGRDHKTSLLQFNNPFNTIFQSHFMLSKARISEPFADTGFWESFLFVKRWRHDLIVARHPELALPLIQAVFSAIGTFFSGAGHSAKVV